ncbi:MAG: hypothetical protein RQ824_07735 [bacterium]|nr:hypothetical protein [bacterium]
MPLVYILCEKPTEAVDFARSGLYPPSIAADLSEERLKRFFSREDDSYRINKRIRETEQAMEIK